MNDEPLLTMQEVADWLQVPWRTLAGWRHRGIGPPYYRVGKHARYRRYEVEEWLAEHRHMTAGRGR